jgi:hypothetical protein
MFRRLAAMNFVEHNQRAVPRLCVKARLVGLRSHRVTTAPLRRMTERLEPAQGQMSQEPAASLCISGYSAVIRDPCLCPCGIRKTVHVAH